MLQFLSRARRLVTVFAGIVVLFAVPGRATSQPCTYNKTHTDGSSPGSLRLQASTTQDNCPGREAEVRGRIEGGMTCHTGQQQGSYCVNKQTDGETNAIVTVGKNACGTADGISFHYMWNPLVTLGEEIETSLDATCTQCEEMDYQTCTANEPACSWGAACTTTPGSPIIIATHKKAEYKLTSPADGVLFDIDGDGVVERIGWTHPDSRTAFLALDRDGDGAITSGKELFGGNTLPGISNGFTALQVTAMETNGGVRRGSVSSRDPIFERLLLWTDRNQNGVSEKSELRPASMELAAIGLSYTMVRQPDDHKNIFLWQGWAHIRTALGRNRPTAEEEDSRRIVIWDVLFAIMR